MSKVLFQGAQRMTAFRRTASLPEGVAKITEFLKFANVASLQAGRRSVRLCKKTDGTAVVARKRNGYGVFGEVSLFVSRGANYASLVVRRKNGWAVSGISAAERKVLGLPKPHPPLECPCPPSSTRYFCGGVPEVWGVRGEGDGGGVWETCSGAA